MKTREQIIAAAKDAGFGAYTYEALSMFDKFYAIAYEDGRVGRDAEIAELLNQVTMLRDAVQYVQLECDPPLFVDDVLDKALAATEPKPLPS